MPELYSFLVDSEDNFIFSVTLESHSEIYNYLNVNRYSNQNPYLEVEWTSEYTLPLIRNRYDCISLLRIKEVLNKILAVWPTWNDLTKFVNNQKITEIVTSYSPCFDPNKQSEEELLERLDDRQIYWFMVRRPNLDPVYANKLFKHITNSDLRVFLIFCNNFKFVKDEILADFKAINIEVIGHLLRSDKLTLDEKLKLVTSNMPRILPTAITLNLFDKKTELELFRQVTAEAFPCASVYKALATYFNENELEKEKPDAAA